MKIVYDNFKISWDRNEDPGEYPSGAGGEALPPSEPYIGEITGWAVAQCTPEEVAALKGDYEKAKQSRVTLGNAGLEEVEYDQLYGLLDTASRKMGSDIQITDAALDFVGNFVIIAPLAVFIPAEKQEYKFGAVDQDILAARAWVQKRIRALTPAVTPPTHQESFSRKLDLAFDNLGNNHD